MTTSRVLPVGEVLADIDALLDRVDGDRSGIDATTWLTWIGLARRVRQRIEATTDLLIAEAEKVQASERAKGTPLASWLGTQETLSRREAKSAVYRARLLGEHQAVGEAAASGRIGVGQARAISGLLDGLSPQLDPGQQNRAEQVLLELSDHLDADQLAKASGQVLAAVAPANADELLERKLQRESEAAHRQRSLRFFREGASIRFDGSLPHIVGEQFIALIEAGSEKLRRTAIEARDPLATRPTLEQRRADALIELLRATGAPQSGSGGARVIVKLDYHKLHDAAAGAGLIGPDQPISAGDLRRLCCGAELIPVVLGDESEVLDVGRSRRFVTPAMLTALIVRDGGCVFPGCDAGPQLCEAHHIVPWESGGPTCLSNLVLLCHHHHGLCEPAKYSIRDQWEIRLAADGAVEFLPPARFDPQRKPLRNRRQAEVAGADRRPGTALLRDTG